MTTFDQELTGRYVAAGAERPSLDDRRVARAVFVRDAVQRIYNADTKFGIDPADNDSLAEQVDAAEEHRKHIANHVSRRSVMVPPNTGGDRMRKHSALGGAALALALTLAGCSDDGSDPNGQDTATATPSPTPPTSSTPPPKTDEDKATAVLERYLTFRDDAYRSGELVNVRQLKLVATGDEFVRLQTAVIDIKQYEIKVTGEYQHSLDAPRRRSDSTFLVTDCEDRSGVEERKDGRPVPPPADPEGNPLGNPIPITYEVVKQTGRWLVSSSDVRWEDEC
jgi:hypothetical protein